MSEEDDSVISVDHYEWEQMVKKAKKWEDSWSNPMNDQYKDVQEAFATVIRIKEQIEDLETKRKKAFYPSKKRGIMYKRIKYLKRLLGEEDIDLGFQGMMGASVERL